MQYLNTINFSECNQLEMAESIRNNQVTVIANVPGSVNPDIFYRTLAGEVGLLVDKEEDPYTGRLVNGWNVIEYREQQNNTAYKYSNTRQPLHTDYGYVSINLDMTFFYCEQQADYGGSTHFLNTDLLIHLLSTYDADLYQWLVTTPVLFGRAGNKVGSRTGKIIDSDDKGILLNWNYYRVSKDNSPEVLSMTEQFHHFLENRVVGGGLLDHVTLKKNEAVFFHDKRILHGRNSFFGPRKLMKAAIVLENIEAARKMLSAI
jgi:alpha-ketoglutarate-dependent taurine dioxygenase